jgi:hypothetical protein
MPLLVAVVFVTFFYLHNFIHFVTNLWIHRYLFTYPYSLASSSHVLPCLALPFHALFCPVLSCPVRLCLVLSCLVLSCLVLYHVLSCPVLSYRVLSFLVLFCPVVSCHVLSYHLFSYPLEYLYIFTRTLPYKICLFTVTKHLYFHTYIDKMEETKA